MKLEQIAEGWKNSLLPSKMEKDLIKHTQDYRLSICNACDQHSKNHTSIRLDDHCVNCGCTLSAKTACLSCECPLKKWTPIKK